MTTLFLFDGGNYKRGIDNSRVRVPLTPQEAELVFYDPEVPGDTDNSIGTEFNMQKWASELCSLAEGDEIFVGLAPDAAYYRSLFMMSFDAVPGLEMNLDLVSVKDVHAAYLLGDASYVPAWDTAQINYDFADGLGGATKDAVLQSTLWGDAETNYRNEDALVGADLTTPKLALLGESLYFRLTVISVPDTLTENGCCSTCTENNMPTFQVGALYDRTCVDKQRVRNFCNCPEVLCGDECDEQYDPTCNGPNVVITFDSENEPSKEVSFLITFDEDVTQSGTPYIIETPTGDFIVDELAIVTPNSYTITGTWEGTMVAGETFDVYIPAGVFTSDLTGLRNCQSDPFTYTIPSPA